jgi:hypothetical protein
MLKIGNNIIRGVYKGTTKISTIYKGGTKIFPGIEYTNTGEDVGSWSYPNNYSRVRTITPWSQGVYQDGSYASKVYGSSYQQSETATTSYLYGIWNYSSGNESRYRDVSPRYTFSDGVVKSGDAFQELENGIPSYSYGTWNYYDGNSYRNRVVNTSFSYSDGVVRSGSSYTSSNEYGSSSYSSWSYSGSVRRRNILYTYDGGITVKTGPLSEEFATVTNGIWDGSTYWNGSCGTNYYFVDYKKVRDQYSFSDTTTYSDYYNGESRSRRIDGQCGWVRAWTDWVNTGSTCNANGVAGQYSCDNTWSVSYYQQVRHYQYPDGTGRTNTEYRAGAEYSRVQTDGQCGYIATQPRREWEYYGYSDYSQEDAWWNCYDYPIGILYQDTTTGLYYSEPTGENLAAPGFYVLQKGFDVDYSIICEVW